MSVGHDEYWSGEQRANVEAARDAGVNLAFFSGNEIFWKTRWEPSIEGQRVPDAGLLQGDLWTAPRSIRSAVDGHLARSAIQPPADGGQPENALTGTIFMVNSGQPTSRSRRRTRAALLAKHRASPALAGTDR